MLFHKSILRKSFASTMRIRSPRSSARAIEKWVDSAVADKGFGTAFAPAREVLEEGAGDCSEHAVLMAALTRAAGIPSRVAAGLVYWERAFAYHMWVEVRVGDGWYALDPTVGHGSVDATFLAIATPAVFGPAYFREIGEVLAATAGGPPDLAAIGEVMRRHGLTPAPASAA